MDLKPRLANGDIITVVQTFILVSYISSCGLLLSDGADEIVVLRWSLQDARPCWRNSLRLLAADVACSVTGG